MIMSYEREEKCKLLFRSLDVLRAIIIIIILVSAIAIIILNNTIDDF